MGLALFTELVTTAFTTVEGLTTLSSLYSANGSIQSGKESRRQQQRQQQLNDVKAAQTRREQIRKARIARAQQLAAGVQTGGDIGSSSVQGTIGNIESQLGTNLSFLDTTAGLQQDIFNSKQNQADIKSNLATAGTIFDFGKSQAFQSFIK